MRADKAFPINLLISAKVGKAVAKAATSKAKTKKGKKETPLMGQYNQIKAKYPDAVLLFRVGDFYETFGQDAIIASKVLGIVQTKRANGAASEIELAGFPHHAVETYLPKLAGYRVSICEQLEDPKTAKTVVKRGVTELITPGVATNDQILDHRSNNFLAAISFAGPQVGIAFLDVSTGEFSIAEGSRDYIDKLLQGFHPSEILVPKPHMKAFHESFGEGWYTYPLEDWIFDLDFGRDKLLQHFETASLKGFGVDDLETALEAAGAALHYLEATEHSQVGHISSIARIPEEDYVWLDRFTIRNLELYRSNHEGGVSLLHVLDNTQSPMGARLLKKWLMMPLKNQSAINERLDAVERFIKDPDLADRLTTQIKQIGDLERLISKVPMGKINPREVMTLRKALDAIDPIKAHCLQEKKGVLATFGDQLNSCNKIRQTIAATLTDDPPVSVEKGHVIREGIDSDLDELRHIITNGKQMLVDIQQREIAATGITSLKVGFNNVFGYYLEVTNAHKTKVPGDWVRKQTLVNAERYITDELKHLEERIVGAEEKILAREKQLYQQLVKELEAYIKPIQLNAYLIAQLDCLLSFAYNAVHYHYRRPQLDDSLTLDIKEGRHPVIEQQLEPGESYIPNDVYLDNDEQQIIIITGPNMSGKSALLRQAALIVLMAQMGSFVPAQSAQIGVIDKIFTRVGASDNISSGESTFMVEMNETASIVNNISDRSLILLDEIGRGTSTYDGISIAWSIAEFLHNNGQAQPKTLFATHYHELNELEGKLPRIKNFNVSVKEVGKKVIFLRKLEPGGSRHSFGIHVARMAGMPPEVVQRAKAILKELEQKSLGDDIQQTLEQIPEQRFQLSLFDTDNPQVRELIETLNGMDINSMTPVEAMMQLHTLVDQVKKIR